MIPNCIKCFRHNSRATAQLMADLPKERVSPLVPFSSLGIDLAGPLIFEKHKSLRKSYAVAFLCFNTKTIDLDLVRSLNGQYCQNLTPRTPEKKFSDIGTKFIGALGTWSNSSDLSERDMVKTHVKSMKVLLRKTIGKSTSVQFE